MQMEQVNTVKNDGKSDEKYDEIFIFLIRSGLTFKYIAIL